MTEKEFLDLVKPLLGFEKEDSTKDFVLKFLLSRVTNRILTYCGLDKLPPQLETTVVALVIEGYRQLNYGKEQMEGEAKTVKRGDTSVTYNTPMEIITSWSSNPGLLNDYKSELNRYRKVRFY